MFSLVSNKFLAMRNNMLYSVRISGMSEPGGWAFQRRLCPHITTCPPPPDFQTFWHSCTQKWLEPNSRKMVLLNLCMEFIKCFDRETPFESLCRWHFKKVSLKSDSCANLVSFKIEALPIQIKTKSTTILK